MIAQEVEFLATLDRAYRTTRKRFMEFAERPDYVKLVVPPATAPDVGFCILYTPATFAPPLLIIALNPANFSGAGADLTSEPNGTMMSGRPPSVNSYLEHDHVFARALRNAFEGYEDLLASAVGMNVWHFQQASNAGGAPKDLKTFCERNSFEIATAMKPKHVICFSRQAFALCKTSGDVVEEGLAARRASFNGSTWWYVPHLTGSWTRKDAELAMPIVLDLIAEDLSAS